jgi:hypothetical protein
LIIFYSKVFCRGIQNEDQSTSVGAAEYPPKKIAHFQKFHAILCGDVATVWEVVLPLFCLTFHIYIAAG